MFQVWKEASTYAHICEAHDFFTYGMRKMKVVSLSGNHSYVFLEVFAHISVSVVSFIGESVKRSQMEQHIIKDDV